MAEEDNITDNAELFIRLGEDDAKYGPRQVYIHKQHMEMTPHQLMQTNGAVYNALLRNKLIRKGESLIIYNFSGKITPFIVTHNRFKVEKLTERDLRNILARHTLTPIAGAEIFVITINTKDGDPVMGNGGTVELTEAFRKDLILSVETLDALEFEELQVCASNMPLVYK